MSFNIHGPTKSEIRKDIRKQSSNVVVGDDDDDVEDGGGRRSGKTQRKPYAPPPASVQFKVTPKRGDRSAASRPSSTPREETDARTPASDAEVQMETFVVHLFDRCAEYKRLSTKAMNDAVLGKPQAVVQDGRHVCGEQMGVYTLATTACAAVYAWKHVIAHGLNGTCAICLMQSADPSTIDRDVLYAEFVDLFEKCRTLYLPARDLLPPSDPLVKGLALALGIFDLYARAVEDAENENDDEDDDE